MTVLAAVLFRSTTVFAAASPADERHPADLSIASRAQPTLEIVLDGLRVSAAQKFTQQTPLAYRDGVLYTINLEPGPDGDAPGRHLLTVIRRGEPGANGEWTWERTVIDDRTPYNPWHTPPAVGVDGAGRVHVAYAMHNTPWRYATSARPGDIGEFTYRGQSIDPAALARAFEENRTDFPTLGSAAIPGNQITYPAFYNDRNGELWVTYRFAAKPARDFPDRTMSAGIARHDSRRDAWTAVGGRVRVVRGRDYEPSFGRRHEAPRALAAEPGWTLYHPRLAFAPDGTLHVGWFWREGGAGATVTRPCHLLSRDARRFFEIGDARTSADPEPVPLPFALERCGNIDRNIDREYYTVGGIAVNSGGDPYLVLSPVGGVREVHYWRDGEWRADPLPYSASEILFDRDDNLWAIASGPNVFVRRDGEDDWIAVHVSDEQRHCGARSLIDRSGPVDRAYLYVDHCGEPRVSIVAFDLVVP